MRVACHSSRLSVGLAALLVGLAAPAHAQLAPPPPGPTAAAPEASSGLIAKPLITAHHQMVVAAHPLAADAGLAILRAGGSAVDAAIAVQLVLNLVEPQSSGIGGGAFLVHWQAQSRQVTTFDGRETAPASATPTQFLKPDGTPLAFPAALLGGTSTGVPGVIALLDAAHKAHGKLPWARLFEPAIALADAGFPVSPRLNALLSSPLSGGPASFDATARAYFYDADGKPWPVGHVLSNPALADTFRSLARDGAAAFYRGPIATGIVETVSHARAAPSGMTAADLAAYRAKVRAPVCSHYRRHTICGMGPPSSGALTVAQTLTLLAPFDLGRVPMNPQALHLIGEAEKLAFADRDRYIADPDIVPQPTGLLDRAYLASRRALIHPTAASPKAEPGTPPGLPPRRAGIDATHETPGTTHIAIVDRDGNAVSMTTTVEFAFGAHKMTGGFLLNNQLTDFSFLAQDAQGRPIANSVAPGKRPRSSMSPTVILGPDGRLFALVGSAGGSEIIPHVVKTIVALLDWHLDPQTAVDLPNFGSRNGPFELETKLAGELLALKLALYGDTVEPLRAPSGLAAIVRHPNGTLTGGADPRREGTARGD